MIKILHIINNLGSGGAEKLIEDTLPIMNEKKNIKVELLLLTDKNNVFAESLKKQGIKINLLGTNNIYNPLNIFSIKRFIKNNDVDIIHVHLFPAIYWTSLATKILLNKKFKLILTEHNTHNGRRDHFYLKPVEKFIYNEYDKVVSISQKTEDNLIDWLGVKKNNKFTIIENGIDTQKFNEAKTYPKKELCSTCSEDDVFITMVGSFSKQKDQKTLINAMEQIDDKGHLFLVGEGQLLEEHKKYVENLDLDNKVHFLGFRNDVERILKTSDIVVLSSHWEGFGLAAVEGMAAGKPVIATDVSGLREVVKNAGLLFEQGDDEELAEIINELIDNKEYYRLVSQKCFKKSKKYDIHNMCKKLIDTYNSL